MPYPRLMATIFGLLLAGQAASAQDALLDLSVTSTKDAASGTKPAPWRRSNVDLNAAAGGNFIYLFRLIGPPTTALPPITSIIVLEGQNAQPPPGYTKVAVDLNEGASGAFLYLAFKRDENEFPLADVGVIFGNTREEALAKMPVGWRLVDTDLNKGCGGSFIYLVTQSVPRLVSELPLDRVDNTQGWRARLYEVRLRGETPVTIECKSLQAGFNPVLTLLSPADAVLAKDDNVGRGPNAKILHTPKANDVYTVRVSGAGNSTGPFRLFVSAEPPPPLPPTLAEDRFPGHFSLGNTDGRMRDAVGQQGNQGACVAWATCGAIGTVFLNTWYLRTTGKPAPVERFVEKGANVLDAKWFYEQRGFTEEGWNAWEALNRATDVTIPFKFNPDYGIRLVDGPSTSIKRDRVVIENGRWQIKHNAATNGVDYGGYAVILDADYMRKLISAGNPLIAEFDVYDDFQDFFKGGAVYPGSKAGANELTGHCVMVVGYLVPPAGSPDVPHWECQNSWGTQWGRNGYFKIARGAGRIDAAMWQVRNFFVCDRQGNKLSLEKENEVVAKAIANLE